MRLLQAQLPKAGKVQRGVIVEELHADANQLAQFQADQQLVSAGTVITTAGTPSSPSSPKVVKTLLIAGVIGLVIGLGLALIREAMDGRIRDADALESRLRAPVLGVIPKFDARSPEKVAGDGHRPARCRQRGLPDDGHHPGTPGRAGRPAGDHGRVARRMVAER